jgi:hyperosmotically inducible protein
MKIINKSLIVAALTGVMSISAMAQGNPELQRKVRHELVMLPYLGVFDNLSYRIDNGVVTLMGEVVRPTLKSDAGNVVKHVEGVKGVVNNIEVLPLSPFDDRIRFAAYRAIYGYGPLQRYGMGTQPSIRIIVKNGHVSLEGVVNNETDRNLANIRANQVPGVFSVSNDLRVVRS